MRHEDEAPRGDSGLPATLDDRLAARLRRGDSDAMAEIYDRYADRIYNFCFRRTASWSAAEDAMSSAFLEAWKVRRKATSYDGSLLPWLCTVADNVCRNAMRGQRRQRALAEKLRLVENVHDHADAVAARVDDERRMAQLVDAIGRLGKRDRQILMLVAWDGLTYRQAAQALGIPVGTVRSRAARARRRLTELMAAPCAEAALEENR
ncbi:MAG TPA: sigma-70 family RNA polymerase sigma factor [Nocardioidaceae bacterium]|nr:sigma-70 family RNA polymerase sigma factor [Nocardioidaceae bacterium]